MHIVSAVRGSTKPAHPSQRRESAMRNAARPDRAKALEQSWQSDPRWNGIRRSYAAGDVERLRNSFEIRHPLAERAAERLWQLLSTEDFVPALGAMTGNQAMQQVKAGLQAIYCSGWQVAADANLSGQMYPDQSLYPCNSVPELVRRINQTLLRADQIDHSEGRDGTYWMAPVVADAEAGFGGTVHAYELVKALIDAGAAGIHLEDQLASEKKCGHLGGKVLVPTRQFVATLTAARLASDVLDVPAALIARPPPRNARPLPPDRPQTDR